MTCPVPGVYILFFGQNIGTCITAVLASIGTSRNAKPTTVIHLMFNIFGTIMFTVLCQVTPLTDFLQSLAPANPSAQIALTHTLFNIVTTLVLLPFGGWMVKAAIRILPDGENEKRSFAAFKIYHRFGACVGVSHRLLCHPSDSAGNGIGPHAVHGAGKCQNMLFMRYCSGMTPPPSR